MASGLNEEEIEMQEDYRNKALPSSRSPAEAKGGVTPAVPGRKLLRVVAVSFGLLCVLQAALNIYLRFTLMLGCPLGWHKFQSSCYYFSISKKNWKESRQECLLRGANLVIINNRGEQAFLKGLHDLFWIGLSDLDNEGQWRWVDGTGLTDGAWAPGEPNNANGGEDCAEFDKRYDAFNDAGCSLERYSVCEKLMS
ncbi:CD209 antigen-like protein C isoform X2 [Genypterus blacodes]|uniref:CD209 antigen-like protein C isoform X2 n=1 Tax=Genypterus blacodes TaxID=154954 RepID=UPI003F760FFD